MKVQIAFVMLMAISALFALMGSGNLGLVPHQGLYLLGCSFLVLFTIMFVVSSTTDWFQEEP